MHVYLSNRITDILKGVPLLLLLLLLLLLRLRWVKTYLCIQSVKVLRPGKRLGDHLVGPAGHEGLDVLLGVISVAS